MANMRAGRSMKGLIIGLVVLIILAASGGGVAYAYFKRIGPFAHPPYGEENLLSGILGSSAKINTASYSIKGSLNVGPRDADAVPFSIEASNIPELRAQYENDYNRFRDVGSILLQIVPSRYTLPGTKPKPVTFPASLADIQAQQKAKNSFYSSSITDPRTKVPYGYSVTEGGKDFALIVTFESDDAIRTLERAYNFAATTTLVSGKTVTFTKESPTFLYFPKEPPKPFLVQLGESMRLLPSEIAVALSVAATTDFSKTEADWKFNVDATGDFGDLSFKINADALKKGEDYYFRVNNIPSIIGQMLASIKGQWIKIDTSASSTLTSSVYNQFKYLARNFPEAEKRYKESRAESTEFMRKIVQLADKEHLLLLKSPPYTESVDGRVLYRYDVHINKAAILPFYQGMIDEANRSKNEQYSRLFNDSGAVQYLKSDEFSKVFDYFDKNTTITIWADQDGFPAVATYTMRVIPPDTAEQMKDKQVNITFKYVLSDINKPVVVEAPADSKPIEDLIQSYEANVLYSLDDARTKGRDARRVADIKQIQLALALYNDETGSYPTTLLPLAPKYISVVPTDPAGSSYMYAPLGKGSSCTSYHLGATLEATNSALSSDSDVSAKASCSGGAPDFEGKALTCGSKANTAASDMCYDVAP